MAAKIEKYKYFNVFILTRICYNLMPDKDAETNAGNNYNILH